MINDLTDEHIKFFMRCPHAFGHYIGYTKLLPIHGQWILDAFFTRKLHSLQAHRGSYKTTSLIIVGSIWYLLFINPDATIGTVRKSDDQAKRIGKAVMTLFETPHVLAIARKVYGNRKLLTLKTSNWSSSSITLSTKKKTTPEGSFEAKGKNSAITGSHYDVLIPDDIITIKDRVSKAERESTFQTIYELKNNVLNPGGIWVFSGTPWHKDDGWKTQPEPVRYPIGSIPLPHITPDYILEKRKGTTASLYAANYELKHIAAEDTIFSDPQFMPWPDKYVKRICAWLDPAYAGKNNTALAMMAQTEKHNHVRGWVWPDSVEKCYDRIINILTDYKNGTLYVETNADKGFSKRDLSLRFPAVVGRNESENKHIRIIANVKKNWNNIYFAEDCQDEFLNEVLDYVEGDEPDDSVDALAGIIREMKIYDQSDVLARRFGI